MTLSQDSGARNFTLGQDGDRYDIRLRTTGTSENGLPSVSTPDNRVSTELTHVVYTRDRSGRARVYVNGQLNQDRQVTGEVSNWDRSYRLALANEFNANRLWRGTYHLVAISNRDLLPQEVARNYRAGPAPEIAPSLAGRGGTAGQAHFHTEIAPLFVERCMECHDTANEKGELDLSKRVTAFKGGESGKVIEPGNAADSLLWKLVKDDEMPDDREPLASEEKQALKQWINDGAVWPVEEIDALAYSRGETAGDTPLRRLTLSEYIETVRSTLGVNIARKARELLPQDVRADGFSNTAYNLNVDLEHVEAYRKLAQIIVDRMDVAEFASKYIDCERLTDDCMRELVAKMGKWILRGPLNDHEVTVFRGIASSVASAGGSFEEAVEYTIQAMLQSPAFLYRIEHQKGDGTRWPVSGYELASRMSYIIWGGPPDEELMQAANEGVLYDRSAVEEQIQRMLKDPRAIKHSLQFVSQWLNLERLDNLSSNPEKFPEWSEQLAEDMRRETLMFFRDVVWGQKRPLADLMNAQITYLTPRLAEHYGIEAKGEGRSRYDLSSISSRGGLLTQGSVLTIGGDEASTVTRGLFVLRDILRGRVGEPPPCLDTSPVPTEPGLTKRAIAKQRIANPSCGGCHRKFEPLSFGLVQYDGRGSYQEEDEHGNKLRDDGKLVFPGKKEPVPYESSAEMMDFLAHSDRVAETMTWKLTQFAVGRPLGPTDVPIVERIHQSAKAKGGTYPALIKAIINSDLVQTIKTEDTDEGKQYTER